MSRALEPRRDRLGGLVPGTPAGSAAPVRPAEIAPFTRDIRLTALAGLVVIALFFILGGGWAATAPLAGAVIAPGVISPEGSRRTVQHLEGGIIRAINVRDGDRVKTGQTLIELEDVSPRSEVGTLQTRLRAFAAMEARLIAERTNAKSIVFDHPLLADRNDPEILAILDQQINQLETRRINDAGHESILMQRIAQLEQQIAGAERQLAGVRRQKDLIREEIRDVSELFQKGYEKKPRLLALQRNEAELLGDEGELVSRIARSREQIGETHLQILNIRQQRLEDTDKELGDIRAKRQEVEEQINNSLDKLSRTEIVAPVDGVVIDLHFKTLGGVVKPGEPLLDIVPENEDLIIDARVSPNDIDDVHAGLHAYVMFPSFSQRVLHKLNGQLFYVSADALTDPRTGQSYFKAKVKVDREDIQKLDPELVLAPGMPAESFITTQSRTLLRYLIQPLSMVLERSFREH
jgi:HlyD family type I secretion membrane fusion protein